jgi:outer membrane protein TolC
MTTFAKIIFASFISFISVASYAQYDTLSVSLNQALAYATEFGYQCRNAEKDIEIAKKKVNETIAIGLPQINSSGYLSNSIKQQVNTIQFGDSSITSVFGTKYNSSIGARVDQLLFDGSYLVGLKASKVYLQLSQKAKTKTDIDIKQAVAESYFLVLVAKQNIIDFKKELEVNEKTLKQSQAYFDNGFIDDIDNDQVKLMVNKSRRIYLESKRQYEVAMVVLKFTMGYPIENPLKITDTIQDLLALIPVKTEAAFNVRNHINFQMIETQIDIQKLSINNQKAKAMPRLSAFANYEYIYFGDELSDLTNTTNSAIGLSLSIPIFSSFQRTAQLKQKKIELLKLKTNKEMIEQNLKQNVFISSTNLSNSREQYYIASEGLDIAQRIFQKSLVKFENAHIMKIN